MALASCGSGSTGDVTPAPTPSPSPSPTPTPVPTPTPTPSSPSGVTITSEATAPLIGSLQYNEAEGSGSARWATDFTGHFPSSNPRLVPGSVITAGFMPDYSRPVYKLASVGIDLNSRLLISATAPVGATTVSPLTSLIDKVGSQSAVRAALQLDTGSYSIPSGVDLTAKSGVDTGSGAISAANFRALLLSQGVYVVERGVGALDYTPFTFQNREERIAEFIRANPSVSLLTQAGAEQLLRATADRNASLSSATYAAMAHLVTIYADAAVAIQSDRSQGTRYLLGLQSFFFYRMENLRLEKLTPAEVQALTSLDIAAEVAAFAEYPTFTATGTLFAGPDFDFLAPGASGSRGRFDSARDGHGNRRTTGYAENDFTFNSSTLSFDPIYRRGGLVSVTVPQANANQVSASIQGTTIEYQALPGFTGTTYFDYVISDDLGQQATARFYIIVG